MNLFFFLLGILASLLSIIVANAIKSASRVSTLESKFRDVEDVCRDLGRDIDSNHTHLADSLHRELTATVTDFDKKLESLHRELESGGLK